MTANQPDDRPADKHELPQQIVIAPPPPGADVMPRKLAESWLFAIGFLAVLVALFILAMWLIVNIAVEFDDEERPQPVGSQRRAPATGNETRLVWLTATGVSPPSSAPAPSRTA